MEGADPFPFLRRAFDLIAFAKVSTSGAEAHRMFLTPADSLSPNPDRLIADAKQVALGLARAGYRPGRPRTDVPALGRPALATFKMMIHNGRRSGQVSEHDALLATHVATILCGGDRPPGRGQRAGLPGPRARGLPLAPRDAEDPGAHPAHAEARPAAPELTAAKRQEPWRRPKRGDESGLARSRDRRQRADGGGQGAQGDAAADPARRHGGGRHQGRPARASRR